MRALFLIKLQLLLAFLKGNCELILNILHLRNEDLLILEPLLQNPVLFTLPLQLELHYDLVFLLLGQLGCSGWVLGRVEGGVAELRSALRDVLTVFLLVHRLLLR